MVSLCFFLYERGGSNARDTELWRQSFCRVTREQLSEGPLERAGALLSPAFSPEAFRRLLPGDYAQIGSPLEEVCFSGTRGVELCRVAQSLE